MITFQSEELDLPDLNYQNITLWIESVIKSYDYKCGAITYLFCSDDYILKVNQEFLQHDYFTDIITFDNCISKVIAGDLLISIDTVKSNAQLLSINYLSELKRVIIHGILHMIGFNDHSDEEKKIMRLEEDKALKLLSTFH